MRRTAISDLKQRRHLKRASLWKIRNVLYLIVGKPCWSPATSWRRAIWTTMSGVESKDVTNIEAANPIWRGKRETFGYLTRFMNSRYKIPYFTFLLHSSNIKWKEQVNVITQTLDPYRKEHNNYEKLLSKSNDDIFYRLCLLTYGNSKEPVSDWRICVVPCPPQEFSSWRKKLGLQLFCF
jgi:hypothetical protein